MNSVQLIGNLGKSNDVKFGQTGTAVLNNSIAIRRSFKDKQTGEYETDWVNIVLFGKTAENFAKFTGKGSKVGIEGRIQSGSYTNQQGQKVYTTEIVVNNFHLIEPKAGGNQPQGQMNQQPTQGFAQSTKPTQIFNQAAQNPFGSDATKVNITEDDLPFD